MRKYFIILLLISCSAIFAQEALFEVKNDAGQVVFAVYSDGIKVMNAAGEEVMIASTDSVRFYIDTNNQRLGRSAFSVKGTANREMIDYFEIASQGIRARDASGQDLMIAESDSVRFYVKNATQAGRLGRSGFSVKGVANRNDNDYLFVSPDSTRLYVENSESGFSIESLDSTSLGEFLNLTSENYFIGHDAGASNTTGNHNAFIGFQAGHQNTSGSNNLFIGENAGYSNTTGHSNMFIGNNSGFANTEGWDNIYLGNNAGYTSGYSGSYYNYRNVFIGTNSGYATTGASSSVFIGYNSGRFTTTGLRNIFIGSQTGMDNTTASDNTFVGENAGTSSTGQANTLFGSKTGYNLVTGSRNTLIGSSTGWSVLGYRNSLVGAWAGQFQEGSYNCYLGMSAGRGASDNHINSNGNIYIGYEAGLINEGNYNVFIGYQAGDDIADQDNSLIINNATRETPLVSGDFADGSLNINANNQENIFNSTLFVNGASIGKRSWGTYTNYSNSRPIKDPLSRLKNLKGIVYNDGSQDRYSLDLDSVKKEMPEILTINDKGNAIHYGELNVVLLEAIKEQQNTIEILKKKVEELENMNEEILKQINK